MIIMIDNEGLCNVTEQMMMMRLMMRMLLMMRRMRVMVTMMTWCMVVIWLRGQVSRRELI